MPNRGGPLADFLLFGPVRIHSFLLTLTYPGLKFGSKLNFPRMSSTELSLPGEGYYRRSADEDNGCCDSHSIITHKRQDDLHRPCKLNYCFDLGLKIKLLINQK